MDSSTLQQAAAQFGFSAKASSIEPLGKGLINATFAVKDAAQNNKAVLQAINASVFQHPGWLQQNYAAIKQYLQQQRAAPALPAIIKTVNNELLWCDASNTYWRCFEFIPHAVTIETMPNASTAFTIANSFAAFTVSLAGFDYNQLKIVIPDFHNLALRYSRFESAITGGESKRLLKATHVIAELRQRHYLLQKFESFMDEIRFPTRVMHHDCKISNLLFDATTGDVAGLIDMDTVMPGKFFSDLGDMLRTMACTESEDSRAWERIGINEALYNAIISGYTANMGAHFTIQEHEQVHYSGVIMVYMQALRFVTDYLNNDVYYKTTYPEQNLNRALNQLILLEKMEAFVNV